jgi:hypothetical protein
MQVTWLGKATSTNLRKWLVSAALAWLTIFAIHVVRLLPHSMIRDRVTDAMTIPGGVFAETYAAAFGETRNWLTTWAWLAIIGNALFYLLLWRGLISLYSAIAKRSKAGG